MHDYLDGVLYNIPIDRIRANPDNPRKTFDPEELEKLAQSIREVGILQPLVLVPEEDGEHLRLVAGERRWRAAQMAGLKSVPAIIRRLTPAQEAEIMLIENLQREDLDPIEEAQAFQALLDDHGYTQVALAEKLGISQSHIANRLRLLRLPDQVKESISRKILSAGHAHALLKLEKAPAIMKKAAEAIVEEQVPVAKAAETVAEVIHKEGMPLFEHWDRSPKFDLAGCQECEFRIKSKKYGFGEEEEYFCIKPSCWEKKQQEAKRAKEEEIARKAQEMAEKGEEILELDKFDYNQYEIFYDFNTRDIDLSQCENCEQKKLGKHSYDDEPREVCFKPSCFKGKKAAAAREKNKQAREAFKTELQEIAGLAADRARKCLQGGIDRQVLIYLAAQILANIDNDYDRKVTRYKYLKEKFGWEYDCLKLGHRSLVEGDDWRFFKNLLDRLGNYQLWEIIFEWPAVAQGLEGFMKWILYQSQDGETPCERSA